MTELGYHSVTEKIEEEFNRLRIILRIPTKETGHVSVSYEPRYGISDDDPIHGRWRLKQWQLALRT